MTKSGSKRQIWVIWNSIHSISPFFFLKQILDNQWQNIMTILKNVFKNLLSPFTMLWTHNIAWHKFYSFFLDIVKMERGGEIKNCPYSSFSHNFCHWLQCYWIFALRSSDLMLEIYSYFNLNKAGFFKSSFLWGYSFWNNPSPYPHTSIRTISILIKIWDSC